MRARGKNRILMMVHAVLFSAIISTGKSSSTKSLSCGDDLFREGSVSGIEITLESADENSLRENPRRNVSAVVRIDEAIFPNVAVHLKGSGTFQTIDQKPSLTLQLKGMPGVSKIHLNNSAEDATYAQEKLGSELFTAAGIPAPRIGHARVKVNGRDKGLYVLKEGFGPEFLARSFSEVDGAIYDKNSSSALTALEVAAGEADLERRWTALHHVLDVDQFVSFLAMEVLLCHWDGYGLANNNFRVYRNATTGRIAFFPAGMDQLFGNATFPLHPDMTGPLARTFLEIPEGKERFAMKIAELGGTFDGDRVAQRATEIALSLRSTSGLSEFAVIREAAEDLSTRIVARGNYVRRSTQAIAALIR